MKPEIRDLIDFLNASPTAWHAVDFVRQRLIKEGFQELAEGEAWRLKPGGQYFIIRNGSTLSAFVVPLQMPRAANLIGSHTDSPAFKIKPNAEYLKENMLMLGVEIYGGPLLTSWLNRDLGIAGRIAAKDGRGNIFSALVRIEDSPLVIPQLAIHLDRNVNENGLLLNKQEHLSALAALNIKPDKNGKTQYLLEILQKAVDFKTLLGYELFLYPLEPARLVGNKQEMISTYRIDSLGSVHAALHALTNAVKPHKDILKMVVFWDNEEIGSNTSQGAGSPFLPRTLERICLALGLKREDYFRLISQSLCLSVDLSHALHPNYPEKHEPRHQALLNKGLVIKTNAQQRYASDALSEARIVDLCHREKIPFQKFVSRNDIPSGSTIGPITANLMGMSTLDIGCAQLSMHSARELAGCQDHIDMCRFLKAFL